MKFYKVSLEQFTSDYLKCIYHKEDVDLSEAEANKIIEIWENIISTIFAPILSMLNGWTLSHQSLNIGFTLFFSWTVSISRALCTLILSFVVSNLMLKPPYI